ncbi:MAG: caspase family protein [Archangiaceae bacterium]|nr:caspase family protein [Archangiaceae bacterium]
MTALQRLFAITVLVSGAAFAQGFDQGPTRFAVIVGSNAPVQERPGLRFSHRDARAFAQVLMDVGRFTKRDVQLLLDPAPEVVLAALDSALVQARAAGGKAMLVFYYSGHADGTSLYPNGQALALADLKSRMSSEAVELRVGILDGCSGGGWTQAKGLKPAEPFAVGLPQLESEGTVLLASSSGLEDAHEAETLQGSFFTHHLVAGLRGAADKSRDGQVTLSEAFAYANTMTIRDTAQVSKTPQHPSFDMRLRGRQDVVLTALSSAASSLTLIQDQGPLQVVQLSTGQLIAETPAGALSMTLAVPAGEYVVRRVDDDSVLSKKVTVEPMSSDSLEEKSLMPSDAVALASKGLTAYAELPPEYEVAAAGGLHTGDTTTPGGTIEAWFNWRLSRKLGWRLLRLQYNVPTARRYDPLATQNTPTQFFRAGSDIDFIFYRSEQTPKGFRFEGQFLVGPSVFGLELPPENGVINRGIGVGPSFEIAADFRLPYLPDLHVRAAAGTDFALAMLREPSFQAVFRASLAFAWRFGGTD